MEQFSVLLALCEGNPSVSGGFPSQSPVTRKFDVFPLICNWTNGWANSRYAVDLRRHCAHCDVPVMFITDWAVIAQPHWICERTATKQIQWYYHCITVICSKWFSRSLWPQQNPIAVSSIETKMLSFWRNFCDWVHWELSFWQLSAVLVMRISSKWRHRSLRFSVAAFCSVIRVQQNRCEYTTNSIATVMGIAT